MACGLFPLAVSFGLGEIADGEMPVLKILLPPPMFPLTDETDDHFHARVELADENVMRSYACGEHDACLTTVPNGGRLNHVFEQASVPYGPCLEPGSKASKEAAGVGLTGSARRCPDERPLQRVLWLGKAWVRLHRRLLHRKQRLLK
jgi:hypothetical protein